MSEGFVYFITSEPDEYVKIGWALHHPGKRLKELQTGCPEALRLMAYAPASREEERRLHATFAELHYRGEWFQLAGKLRDLVMYLSDNWPKETEEGASRRVFEGATWDVIIAGTPYPGRWDEDFYARSGNGALWMHLHPEEIA